MSRPVLEVVDVHKTFHVGFWRKRVEAVRGVSFRVEPGAVFGLLGPNGAGKTTTLKMMLGLVRPTRGEVSIFGKPPTDREGRARLGYLPENPYVYQYLRPLEFLDLCGAILGLSKRDRTARASELIDRVGLRHAIDRPIGKFSKGMMQRVGLAQCLLQDPELIVLDEPMSGLDPIGRKEVRDLLMAERARGKTILITTHILNDVEMLCDHVAILRSGVVVASGGLSELLRSEARKIEIELQRVSPALLESLRSRDAQLRQIGDRVLVHVDGPEAVQSVLAEAMGQSAQVVAVTPHKETLEELFVRNAMRTGD